MMHRNSSRVLLIVAAFALFLVPVAAIAAGGFDDVDDDNVFKADIAWLADAGVTKGCDPPSNTKFCPGDNVTREQMSAFMHRLAVNRVVDAGTVQGKTAAQLKGQKGDPGPTGPAGPAGPAGPPGADGVLPDGTPPVGTTARGTYALTNDSNYAWDSIGWGFEMPSPPTVHVLEAGEDPSRACPGTPTQPEAAKGYLCVYESYSHNRSWLKVHSGASDDVVDAADTFGARISAGNSAGAGTQFKSYGTWAITVGTS